MVSGSKGDVLEIPLQNIRQPAERPITVPGAPKILVLNGKSVDR